jgi:hypothetical protein
MAPPYSKVVAAFRVGNGKCIGYTFFVGKPEENGSLVRIIICQNTSWKNGVYPNVVECIGLTTDRSQLQDFVNTMMNYIIL